MKKYIEAFIDAALLAGFAAVGIVVSAPAFAQISNPTQVGPGGRPTTFTAHGLLLGQTTSNVTALAPGTSNFCLLSGGAGADPTWGSCASGSSGTVTSASVVSANGLAGTVATATTTPAITLSTTVTGLVKGNGTALSAATAGTDYAGGKSDYMLGCQVLTAGQNFQVLSGCNAVDSTGASLISFTASFIKSSTAPWAAGSSQGAMGNGLTAAANTWYYVYAIINGGVADAYLDTSNAAANKPAGTTAFRYIGSLRTGVTAIFLPYSQNGNRVYWNTAVQDLTNGVAITPTFVTLSIPPAGAPLRGVRPIMAVSSAVTGKYYITSGITCTLPAFENTGVIGGLTLIESFPSRISPGICYQADSVSSPVNIWTVGYVDESLPNTD